MAVLSILGIAGLFLNNLFNPKGSPVEVQTRTVKAYSVNVIKTKYDFLTPKEGVGSNSSSKKIQKIAYHNSQDEYKRFSKRFIHYTDWEKQPYAMVRPLLQKRNFYFC